MGSFIPFGDELQMQSLSPSDMTESQMIVDGVENDDNNGGGDTYDLKMNRVIKSTKRRIVPHESRKRALFSCDRCKMRKTGCKRIQSDQLKYDNITPCIQCTKSGVECTTTIPRKKRIYGPVENIGLHYKCLLNLVTGLFPDKDINNIEELIELGVSLKISMPSMANDTDSKEINDLNKLLNFTLDGQTPASPQPSSSQTPLVKEEHSSDDPELVAAKEAASALENLKGTSESKKKPKLIYGRERLLVHRGGNTHYIGSQGTSLLLNGLSDVIIKNSIRRKNTASSSGNLSSMTIRHDEAHILNSENEPIYEYPSHLSNTDLININKFPLVNLLNKEELAYYTDVFFEKIHPYYFCFNEDKFRKKYELFWKEVNTIQYNFHSDNSTTSSPLSTSNSIGSNVSCRLSNSEICCIYIVWLLGRRFNSNVRFANDKKPEMDNELATKFIDIIKLSLLDILLTPTLNGVRLLFLLAIYLDSLRTKESAWILLELAGRQSISLGIHRKSIVSKFKPDKQDEMKRIVWSIFKLEMTFGAQLGRSSTFIIEEINVSLPLVNEVRDPLYKKYYTHGVTLSQIMYQILENRKPLYLNNEPLSLHNIERAMKVKINLQKWWEKCDEELKDYRSTPFKRYKIKLHIQYHYYLITLTLPYMLYIVNNSNNYILKKDDPLLGTLCLGIKSAIATSEILTFADAKGFFNGSIYMDIFYGYNAIMILILTYILIKGNSKSSPKYLIDIDYLNDNYQIDLNSILYSINLIRMLNLKNSSRIDGSMKRASDIVEILSNDLGIVSILDEKFGSPIFVSPGYNPNNNLNVGNDNYDQDFKARAQQRFIPSPPGLEENLEPINYSFNNDVLFDSELIDLLFGNENLFNDYNQMSNNINKN